jgi:hypothetical protein
VPLHKRCAPLAGLCCVQGLPLSLNGVMRIMDKMDWGEHAGGASSGAESLIIEMQTMLLLNVQRHIETERLHHTRPGVLTGCIVFHPVCLQT